MKTFETEDGLVLNLDTETFTAYLFALKKEKDFVIPKSVTYQSIVISYIFPLIFSINFHSKYDNWKILFLNRSEQFLDLFFTFKIELLF